MNARSGSIPHCPFPQPTRMQPSVARQRILNHEAAVQIVGRGFKDVATPMVGPRGNDLLPLILPRVRRLDDFSKDGFRWGSHAVADEENSGGKAQEKPFGEGRGLSRVSVHNHWELVPIPGFAAESALVKNTDEMSSLSGR